MTISPPPASKNSAINLVFTALLVLAIVGAAYSNRLTEITEASFESAKTAVELSINLIGVMALWLGLVRVLEAGGLIYNLADWIKPVMVRLFPDIPLHHPALGAIVLNFAANILGLGNAATPLGIKAMVELNKLNPNPGTATNAMCMFLAINTSSITLFPLTVIGIRAAANSAKPAAIWLPTLLATITSTAVAIAVCLLVTRGKHEAVSNSTVSDEETDLLIEENYSHLLYPTTKMSPWLAWLLVLMFFGAILRGVSQQTLNLQGDWLSDWLIPALILAIIAYGVGRGVKVYEAITEGAKQGFDIAIRIIPFLVAILVAIGMFRASGMMDSLMTVLTPYTSWLGMPPETLPMALIRPLSGSGALGVMTELLNNAPDSYEAFVASVMMGSTETTFYVLAVYFGSVGISKIRHTLLAALLADAAGLLSACFWSRWFWP